MTVGGNELPRDSEIHHILPDVDLVEHIASPSCICDPIKEVDCPDTGDQVWVHRVIVEQLQ
jgi:hypothetical protein